MQGLLGAAATAMRDRPVRSKLLGQPIVFKRQGNQTGEDVINLRNADILRVQADFVVKFAAQ